MWMTAPFEPTRRQPAKPTLSSEVGAWSNPLSRDAATAAAAMQKCKTSLSLADRIGSRCCVNIAGARGRN